MIQNTDQQPKGLTPTERAKERLKAFRKLQRSIDCKIERIIALEQQLTSAGGGSLDGMPKSPGYEGDRKAKKIDRLVDLKRELEEDETREQQEYKALMNITKMMEKADERLVIQMRYLDAVDWKEICAALYGSNYDFDERTDNYMRLTFYKHGAALKSFGKLFQ